MDHILVADKVGKRYGNKTVLQEVSLEIPANCIYGLLGPNGAGKTTLIRIINQITLPDTGTVYFNGKPLAPEHVAHIGYLPEERGLYKNMKVGEQAMYLAQLKGLTKQEAKTRLEFWFEKLGIEGWWHKKVQELSKGMAQKVQFVVTVLHRPKLLIFDEPFSGFDPINAQVIKDEILALKAEGASVIFSTHRMESVEELCDHIALIHQSKKILDGELAAIKNSYKRNKFRIGLQTSQQTLEQLDAGKNFSLLKSQYDHQGGQFRLELQIPSPDTGAMLGELSQWGNINHLEEIIPSTSEIFIKAVQQEREYA